MSTTEEINRTYVTSPDGTPIAVFASGRGRPLVFVHGTTAEHSAFRLVVSLLQEHMAVHAVDRRGRGDSGDSAEYSLAREHADVAAVVDAAAAAWGGPVDLLGHSYGGNVAFGAATRTRNLRRLVLYEGWPMPDLADRTTPPGLLDRLEALIAEGRREEGLELFYRDVAKVSEAELAGAKAAPTWPARVAAVHTVPREIRAFGEQGLDPREAALIDVPTLLLIGSESPADVQGKPEVVAAALPDARIHTLQGQGHLAYLTDPEGFAAEVMAFLAD